MLAQSALCVVEENIGFQRAALGHAKPQCLQAPPDFPKLARESQLNFDLDLQSDTLVHRQRKCQTAR